MPFQGIGFSRGFVAEMGGDLDRLLFSSFAPASTVLMDSQGNAIAAGTDYTTKPYMTSPTPGQQGTIRIEKIDSQTAPAVSVNSIQQPSPAVSGLGSLNSFGIAPGSLVRIAGNNMGPQSTAPGQFDSSGKVASQAAGVQVLFDGVPAPVLQVQAQNLQVMAPFALDGKASTQVVVVNGNQQSNAVTVPMMKRNPQVLAVLNSDFTVNSAANPAKLGNGVTLYIAGLGQTNPAGVDGAVNTSPSSQPLQPVTYVSLGGVACTITAQGSATGLVSGISQLNVQLPSSYSGTSPANLIVDTAPAVSVYFVSAAQ
jgi:uncharacterized protein (TIGR03437 family)